MSIDFDSDISLVEKEQTILLEPNFEQMPMNLKEGDCYVVNHSEGLTAVDFGDHVSLAEKEGAGMAERRSGTERWGAPMAAAQRRTKGWAAAAKGMSNSRGDWVATEARLRQREEETKEADATAPAPIATVRGCSRGRGCNCEAAVEKAAALAFGVVEATGEGVERCRGDQRRSGVGSCPTWR
ncbi:hypothetical protein BHM03_00034355 [Ensete ventricosum]|nr:hypothetical protein BHM03_00034355 [Ensete ventricosum]